MREIKFRAWDTLLNKFIDESFTIGQNNSIYHAFDCVCGSVSHDEFEPNRIVLMQYTGLKDKNGKEIYEGDILADEDIFLICAWSDRYACFYWYANNNVVYEYESTSELEVIGNIYENKDLLV